MAKKKPRHPGGRPRIGSKKKTVEQSAPWIKMKISRRTWYRRKANGEL